MQETYGSGELISGALGYHFHPRGTNLSIHSRFPFVEDISVHEAFKCVGAIIDLPDEAKASADAMRRVVSDQITALSALADVVRRHGDRIDLSGPGIRPVDGAN